MGIPAAFRWLSNKYPKIISPVIEDQPVKLEDGAEIPIDITRENPNGEEFDNLYLDMNGIVHPCSHPEDKPAPQDEEEMMLEIFKYTERVFNMVRPRKILMIAVDGVAPRAKMNQQRSRRFRTAKEAAEKEVDKQELIKLLKQQNQRGSEPMGAEAVVKSVFDSNAITPGTPFMDVLALSLRYWCQYKLNTDPGWAKVKVIISDATVPGEGEHKVMAFVRSQRASPDHDPNTRHVLYGLDADLIMLALATHEAHFRVLREDVFFQDTKARVCKLCGQKGHEARSCKGEMREKRGEHDEKDPTLVRKPFIWLHVPVLKEYLDVELRISDLPFRFDIERAIDDWIFMCCFVGNDFLPHLPALEIREHGIDTLTTIWKDNLASMGGYVTKDGHIDLKRAQTILDGLAKQEDAIFKRRKEQEDRREANFKRRRLREDRGGSHFDNAPLEAKLHHEPSPALTYDMVVSKSTTTNASIANKSAASVLKDRLKTNSSLPGAHSIGDENVPTATSKRKAADQPAEGEMNIDTVRLWEDGYQDRYYKQKFDSDAGDIEFRHQVARAYVEGLAWVLLYYFQGCPSWSWYYPYHYAPFATDFKDLPRMDIHFEKGRISRPFEQLMSVLPAASRRAIPDVFHPLMLDADSEIIDFYPEDFQIDLNGKKMAWQGVALLPFIDMDRLLSAVQAKYPSLTKEDAARNEQGRDIIIFSDQHERMYDQILTAFYSKKQDSTSLQLDPKLTHGLSGQVEKCPGYLPHAALEYPLGRKSLPDLDQDHSITVYFDMPHAHRSHKSMLLRGAKPPQPILNRHDVDAIRQNSQRHGRSFQGVPLGRFDSRRGVEPIHFGSTSDRSRGSSRRDVGYSRHPGNDYSRYEPPLQQPHWAPPPPGSYGFGQGLPPPPPPTYHYNGYGKNPMGAAPAESAERGPSPSTGTSDYRRSFRASHTPRYTGDYGRGGYSSHGNR